MVLRSVNRLGVVIGGGFFALATAVSTLEAHTPAPRQTTPARGNPNDASITVTGCLLLGPYGYTTYKGT